MNKLDEMISRLPEAAKEYIKSKKLDEVECVIADLPGIARGKAVPATKFSRQRSVSPPWGPEKALEPLSKSRIE